MRIIVVGGGISGLAAAFRLRQRRPDAAITVLESAPRLGGAVQTERTADGAIMELGPDSIIRAKPAGIALIKDLGLEAKLQDTEPTARRSFIARGHRLVPVPEGLYLMAPGKLWPFAFSPIMSLRGKLRMAKDLLIPPGNGGDESLGSFVRRRLGQEALDRIAQPLVGGIYTADPEKLSLAATMPQFLEMERQYGSMLRAMRAKTADGQQAKASGPRYGLFATLQGGLHVLVETLAERLRASGVDLLTDQTVTGVRRGEDGRFVVQLNGSALGADAVVLAQPAWGAAAVLRDLDPGLSAQLASIAYASVATVNLIYPEGQAALPAGAGFVVPAIEGRSLLALTFSSRKYGGRTPAGRAVVRAFVGGALHGHHLDRDDDAMVNAVRADLADLLKIHGAPERVIVSRWPRAMAQYHLGHLDLVKSIRAGEKAHPGLALIGNGFEGVGIPDLVAQAAAAAQRLAP